MIGDAGGSSKGQLDGVAVGDVVKYDSENIGAWAAAVTQESLSPEGVDKLTCKYKGSLSRVSDGSLAPELAPAMAMTGSGRFTVGAKEGGQAAARDAALYQEDFTTHVCRKGVPVAKSIANRRRLDVFFEFAALWVDEFHGWRVVGLLGLPACGLVGSSKD